MFKFKNKQKHKFIHKLTTMACAIGLLGGSLSGLAGLVTKPATTKAFNLSGSANYSTYWYAPLLDANSHSIKVEAALDEHQHLGTDINAYREYKMSGLNLYDSGWGTQKGTFNLNTLKINDRSGINNDKSDSVMKGYFESFLANSKAGTSDLDDNKNENMNASTNKKKPLNNKEYLAFSFPGNPQQNSGTNGRPANSTDRAKGDAISKGLINDFNKAMAWVYNNRDESFKGTPFNGSIGGGDDTNAECAILALRTASMAANQRAPFSGMRTSGNSGRTRRYYITFDDNGSKEPLIYGQSKGYKDSDDFSGGHAGILTWPMVAAEATAVWAKSNTTYSNSSDVSKPSILTQGVTDMMNNIESNISNFLGIPPLGDLIFNTGSRSNKNGFYYGIAERAWFNVIQVFLIIFSSIATIILATALAKDLYKYYLQTLTVAQRIQISDDLRNLSIALVLLILYPFLFDILIRLNYYMVDMFRGFTGTGDKVLYGLLGGSSDGIFSTLAGVFISFAALFINGYFFFRYIARALIILGLYASGPMFIAQIAHGDGYIRPFMTWLKELVGNIFAQAIQAMVFAFIIRVAQSGAVGWFENICMIIAVIPITKFFKKALGIDPSAPNELTSMAQNWGTTAFRGINNFGRGGGNAPSSNNAGSNSPSSNGSSSNARAGASGGDGAVIDSEVRPYNAGNVSNGGPIGGGTSLVSSVNGGAQSLSQMRSRGSWLSNNSNSARNSMLRAGGRSNSKNNSVTSSLMHPVQSAKSSLGGRLSNSTKQGLGNAVSNLSKAGASALRAGGMLASIGAGTAAAMIGGRDGSGVAKIGNGINALANRGANTLSRTATKASQYGQTKASTYMNEHAGRVPNTKDSEGLTQNQLAADAQSRAQEIRSNAENTMNNSETEGMNKADAVETANNELRSEAKGDTMITNALADTNSNLGNAIPDSRVVGQNSNGVSTTADTFAMGEFSAGTGIRKMQAQQDAVSGQPLTTFIMDSKGGQLNDSNLAQSDYGKGMQALTQSFGAAQAFAAQGGQLFDKPGQTTEAGQMAGANGVHAAEMNGQMAGANSVKTAEMNGQGQKSQLASNVAKATQQAQAQGKGAMGANGVPIAQHQATSGKAGAGQSKLASNVAKAAQQAQTPHLTQAARSFMGETNANNFEKAYAAGVRGVHQNAVTGNASITMTNNAIGLQKFSSDGKGNFTMIRDTDSKLMGTGDISNNPIQQAVSGLDTSQVSALNHPTIASQVEAANQIPGADMSNSIDNGVSVASTENGVSTASIDNGVSAVSADIPQMDNSVTASVDSDDSSAFEANDQGALAEAPESVDVSSSSLDEQIAQQMQFEAGNTSTLSGSTKA